MRIVRKSQEYYFQYSLYLQVVATKKPFLAQPGLELEAVPAASPFDTWWAAYPKKTLKKKCAQIWKRRKLDRISAVIINDTRRRAAKHGQWLKGYIHNPSTYLNNDIWEDPIEELKVEEPKAPRLFVPKVDDALVPFARQHGFPEPGKTETYHEYRSRLWLLVKEREA